MNARTQPNTIYPINSTTKKTTVETTPKRTPQKSEQGRLRGDTSTHVGASIARPNARKPNPSFNVKGPKPIKNSNTKIGFKAPIKIQNTSPNKDSRLGSRNVNPLRQATVKSNSSALSGRVATSARVGPSGPSGIQTRLKKKSPWFSSIMEPIKGGAVKIPDPVGTDTGTYQHVENVSVAVNANGVSGLRIISPYCNNFHYAGADDDGSNYQTTTSLSKVTDLSWGSTAVPGQGAYPFARVPAMMKSTAQSHRVVSCSVIAQPEVSTLSDAGEMCAFVKPFDVNDSNVTYPTLQSQWDSALMPVNAHKPLIARWYPIKSDFELFNTITSINNVEPPVVGYDDFIDPDVHYTLPNVDQGVIPWEIGIVCSGMTASTGVVRYQIVVNYEFVPKTQTTMISADPSPVDPTEEQLVCSWVSDCPVTGVVSQKLASSAQQMSTVAETSEPSGFGMIYNVVEEMLPLIKMGAAAFA